MSFGDTLRTAREAKGLTPSQIAAQTRILVQIVEEMENEDFHRIAAAIYGRGFVKLVAECLDLDPQPLLHEFMEIFEGRRAPTVRTRSVPTQEAFVDENADSESGTASQEVPPVARFSFPPVEQSSTLPPVADMSMDDPGESFSSQQYAAPEIEEVPPLETPTQESALLESNVESAAVSTETSMETSSGEEDEYEQENAPEDSLSTSGTSWDSAKEPPAINIPPIAPNPFAGTPTEPSLFDPPIEEPSTPPPTPQPPLSPYAPYTGVYDEGGLSAGERFRAGLSSVSHSVVSSVRSIPRSAWRIAVLVLGALIILGLMAWSCVKLYRITEGSTPPPHSSGATTVAPVPSKSAPEMTKPAAPQRNVSKPKTPVQPRKLSTTGVKIPSLYVD